MLYGSTIELAEQSNSRQPCGFFVFGDGIVAIRPPVGSLTFSMNEANNVRAMAMVCIYGIELTKRLPDISAEAFASTMRVIDDQAGRPVQTEAIAMVDITRAELTKNGLFAAKVTLQTKDKELVLVGGKKVVKEFGGFLAEPLGSRLSSLLK